MIEGQFHLLAGFFFRRPAGELSDLRLKPANIEAVVAFLYGGNAEGTYRFSVVRPALANDAGHSQVSRRIVAEKVVPRQASRCRTAFRPTESWLRHPSAVAFDRSPWTKPWTRCVSSCPMV